MATVAPPAPRTASVRMPRETTLHEIIASARLAPAAMRQALLVTALTSLCLWASFTPVDFGPLGWVALAPLLTLARIARPTRRMYLATYLGGLGFWLVALQWMRLGHPTMYGALLALSLYLALYFPLFLALCRVSVWRLGVPLTLAAPILWTGLELLRGHLMSGFSWYYLGHTQYRWIELIQLSDLVGVYGVSFLLVMSSACLVELMPSGWLSRLKLLPAGGSADPEHVREASILGRRVRVAACLTLVAASLGYGYWRRGGTEFSAGPKVALIQTNFTSEVKHDPSDWPRIQKQLDALTGMAVKQQPDIIVWPETMFRWPLFEAPLDLSDEQLQEAHPDLPISWLRGLPVKRKLSTLSQMSGAAMVVGLETHTADLTSKRAYNSAAFVRPDGELVGRYDKLHRVPFGEFVPLVETFPWLRNLTPYSGDSGIAKGTAPVAFQFRGSRFAPIICFEDTVPHLVRRVLQSTTAEVDGQPKRVDFLVNLTNDGWFHGSSELDQHLITAAFRCVEFRTPMVRAVNTGISAFIDGDGVIRRRAEGIRYHRPKQEEAIVVDTIPLDGRQSLYLAHGDWFASVCLVAGGAVFLTGLTGRLFAAKRPSTLPNGGELSI